MFFFFRFSLLCVVSILPDALGVLVSHRDRGIGRVKNVEYFLVEISWWFDSAFPNEKSKNTRPFSTLSGPFIQ